MMRSLILSIVAVLGAGCGGAPEPFPWTDLDAGERRYQAPTSSEKTSTSRTLLEKEELTLQDVLHLADVLNPELAAERKAVDIATAAIWDAKLYPNPTLLAQIEDYPTTRGGSFGDAKRVVGLGIPLVVSGRIGAATSLAEKERDVAALHFVWRRREILGGVQKAFIALLASRRNADLARETRDLAKSFHAVTDERFKAQAIPEMELLKAAVNLAKAEIDLKLVEKDLAVALKALHAAMGSFDFPKERFAGELGSRFTSASLEALRGQVLASHPLLEEAQCRKESSEAELSLARRERIPDPVFEVLGGRNGEDASIVEAGVSIPLPLFSRNQGKIAAAEARIRKAELEAEVIRNDLLLRLTDAYRTFAVAQERVSVYQDDILPKAARALAQTDEGYRQGKFSLLDVLDAQRTLAEARIASSAGLADLNLAVAELEKLTGTRLEAVR
jgi:cobalt-zinc-cadmium efflux system outer membrane protein